MRSNKVQLVSWVNEYYVQQEITRKQYEYPTTRSIDITSNQSPHTSVEELVAKIADLSVTGFVATGG